MPFDYKKEFKEFYMPKNKPSVVDIPRMNFVAVRGRGDPNDENGEYKRALEILYGISFTIKMSRKSGWDIDSYFEYVVPPLEGLWKQGDNKEIDYTRKDKFEWISMIRLPDFVTADVFADAVKLVGEKKKTDFSKAEFFAYHEGISIRCMHIGTYDSEPATIEKMRAFAEENGYRINITNERFHHEIYLSDPRRTAPEKLKTVISLPVIKS